MKTWRMVEHRHAYVDEAGQILAWVGNYFGSVQTHGKEMTLTEWLDVDSAKSHVESFYREQDEYRTAKQYRYAGVPGTP